MKYIITESKLDSMIDEYITYEFRGLKLVVEDKHRVSWVGDEGEPVIIILSDDDYFDILILEDVYRSVVNMFSIKEFEEIQKHLIRWFNKHMGIEVDEVKTFDNGEYVY
jgi:hypothetical protein